MDILLRPAQPEPAQPTDSRSRTRATHAATRAGPDAPRPFERLSCFGHHLNPGAREGEGLPQGTLLGAGSLRTLRLEDRMGLWVQGSALRNARRRHNRICAGSPANCDERPIGEFLVALDGHDGYLADKGFSSLEWERRWLKNYGAMVAATPQKSARRAWPESACRWTAGERNVIE